MNLSYPFHLLLALVIAVGFCLLLVAGSFATLLLVVYLHRSEHLGVFWRFRKPPPDQLHILSWCAALIFLLSLGVLYLPPTDRFYAAIGAATILMGFFIAMGIHIDGTIRNHTP